MLIAGMPNGVPSSSLHRFFASVRCYFPPRESPPMGIRRKILFAFILSFGLMAYISLTLLQRSVNKSYESIERREMIGRIARQSDRRPARTGRRNHHQLLGLLQNGCALDAANHSVWHLVAAAPFEPKKTKHTHLGSKHSQPSPERLERMPVPYLRYVHYFGRR